MALVVGLTGNIACGKSAIGKFLLDKNIPVIDSDKIVHKLYQEDKEMQDEILAIFGSLDRKEIGKQVFSKPELRKKIEAIIHPRVDREFQNWVKGNADAPLIVNLVPLLFEVGLETRYDKIVTVTCSRDIQVKRLKARNAHMSDEEINARIDSQMDQAQKAAKSDFVIENNGSLADLETKTHQCFLKHL